MGTSSSTSIAGNAPDRAALLRVLRHLVQIRHAQGIVRLTERWSEEETLPREAALAQARVLLDMCLMDRAWVRLKERTDADEADADAWLLTAEMFVARGWPARARKVLDRARELNARHPRLPVLEQRAEEPPLQPPANAREIERTGTPEQLVELAERFMATGSVLRAKGLLDRLHRADASDRRVSLLLWGLRGEFVGRNESLADLVRELGPPDVGEWDQTGATDVVELDLEAVEAETAEVSLHGDQEPAPQAFPSLFRRPGLDPEPLSLLPEDDEATVAAHMATPEELLDPPTEEYTHPGSPAIQEAASDTQIMSVILSDGRPSFGPADGPLHRPREEEPDALRSTLDLRAYQRAMGVTGSSIEDDPPTAERTVGEGLTEEEDLVVLTRREPVAPAPPEVPSAPRKPLEVIEKYPTPRVQPRPAPPPSPPVAPLIEASLGDDEPLARQRPPTWLKWVPVGLVLGALLGAGAWGGAWGVQRVMAGRIVETSHHTLAEGDYNALRAVESSYAAQVAARRSPVAVREVELALVSIVLSDEYTGDHAARAGALATLDAAEAGGADAVEVATARAMLALAAGDLSAAREWSEKAGTGTAEARATASRVALAEGDGARAVELAAPFEAPGTGVRHKLIWIAALEATGNMDRARVARDALHTASPSHPLVRLAALQQTIESAPPSEQLAAVVTLPKDGALPPRLEGQLRLLRSRAFFAAGDTENGRRSLNRALAVDGASVAALYVRAADAILRGSPTAALQDVEACTAERPFDPDCQRAALMALLELGRTGEAVDRLAALRGAWDGTRLADALDALDAWVLVSRGEFDTALKRADAAAESPAPWPGVAAAARGVALGELGDERADAALAAAVTLLSDSRDPLDQLIAARSVGARALYGPVPDAAQRARESLELAPSDAGVYVLVARSQERTGASRTALASYDSAVALGPENAEALYWRGRTYVMGRSSLVERGLESWRRYLELSPSGARADEVREYMARR